MHANIHASMAVSPSALGVLVVTLLKMFTNTRNRVTSRAILPGITSIGIKNNFKYEVQERAVNAVSVQQLAEEYWRIDKFFLISFPILFFVFNIIYWLAFIL
jgi:hypothetical protein